MAGPEGWRKAKRGGRCWAGERCVENRCAQLVTKRGSCAAEAGLVASFLRAVLALQGSVQSLRQHQKILCESSW